MTGIDEFSAGDRVIVAFPTASALHVGRVGTVLGTPCPCPNRLSLPHRATVSVRLDDQLDGQEWIAHYPPAWLRIHDDAP